MIAHRNARSFLKLAVFLLLVVRSYGDSILSLTFDDPSGVFAAYPEGISLRETQNTGTISETGIASGVGGKAQLRIEGGDWVEGKVEPPKSFQLIADPVMGTKGFLRLINNKQVPGTRGVVVITPNAIETSPASLSQIENGKVVFDGGLDLFFRYNEENPSQQELVPNLFSVVGDGIRLIVEADGGSIAATFSDGKDEAVFDTDLDGAADASRVKTQMVTAAPIEPETAYHLAISLQTADTGVVTAKVFLKAGNGAIDTKADTDLVSKADFSIITDNSEKSLKNGDFTVGAESRSSPEKAIVDLAAFRIFRPAPTTFPDISGEE
jgi:hypothetical protein